MATRYQCDFINNPQCKGRCNKEERQDIAESDLCGIVRSVSDGLPIRCVGEWAQQKIYLLTQYFGIFAQGMSNRWKGKINYIEICCGPGRCVNRQGRSEFDGTALSVIKRPEFKHINKALFFDINETVVTILNQRLSALKAANAIAYSGDYKNPETICSVLRSEIKPDSLNLVIVDPTDCSVPFGFISSLKRALPRMDLLINVAVGTDFNRNIKNTLIQPQQYKNTMEKYCSFLGDNGFYSRIRKNSTDKELRTLFLSTYENSLRTLGFSHFQSVPVERYYYIMFASQSGRGIDFWKKATKYDYVGQGSLF